MWRGCIPNPNMFADEYECVQACVFSVRAKADNYHQFQQENIISSSEETTEQPVSTTVMGILKLFLFRVGPPKDSLDAHLVSILEILGHPKGF